MSDSEKRAQRIISVPTYPELSIDDATKIVNVLKNFFESGFADDQS
jgi:dTDP-4-amino-4,6-dideoxygalactose transaminase